MVYLKSKVGKKQLRLVTCKIPLPRLNKNNPHGVTQLASFGEMRPSEVLKTAVFFQQENTQLQHINSLLKERVKELEGRLSDSSFDEITELVSDEQNKTGNT